MKQITFLILVLILVGCGAKPSAIPAGVIDTKASTVILRRRIESVKTTLKLEDERFEIGASILVDVWIENQAKQDIKLNQFSPISSSVGTPDFIIRRVDNGEEFSIPIGLYGSDWEQWYQPVQGKGAFSVGSFSLPAGKQIHLLHGDLHLAIVRAREHCQQALDEKRLLEQPESAITKKHYQDIVKFASDFLCGGTFDICVQAYSTSNAARIIVNEKN